MKPPPITTDHSESDESLSAKQANHFETVVLSRLPERTQTQYGLVETPIGSETAEDEGWGSRPNNKQPAPADSTNSMGSPQSSSIGRAASGSASDDEKQENDTDTTTSLLGNTGMAESGKPADEEEKAAVDESGSSPVRFGGIPVPDDRLQRRGFTYDDVRFLARVLDVMNRDAPNRTLLNHMNVFKSDFGNLDVQRLARQNLLEEGRTCSWGYYTVLPASRELLGQKFKAGFGQGDVGEKTPHKVDVKLLERWLDSRDDVAQVKLCCKYNEETVFDIIGFDADGKLVWVGEAELQSSNKHAPADDYDEQNAADVNAVWAFNRREAVVEALDCLAGVDWIERSVGGRAARWFPDIRGVVEPLNAEGMVTIRSFNKLDEEPNSWVGTTQSARRSTGTTRRSFPRISTNSRRLSPRRG